MTTQAVQEIAEPYAPSKAVEFAPTLDSSEPSLWRKLLNLLKLRFSVRHARQAKGAARFVWDVAAKDAAKIGANAVYCVTLPTSNARGRLDSYRFAGVPADHVVFVGNSLSLSDDEYDHITKTGALVHETAKRKDRQETQKELTPYFEPALLRKHVRPSRQRNPYVFNPGTPKVTLDQLQAHVDAIGRRRT